jgi:hypothetical protein
MPPLREVPSLRPLAQKIMVSLSAAASPFCRPEEDPFLLLESTLRSIEVVLMLRRGLPLRRTWSEQPYGEEEITRLEEEVLPAIRKCLARVDELDERLQAQQELLVLRCELEAGRSALSDLRPALA